MNFFAQPYDMDAKGFYFSDVETFQAKMAEARNVYGQKVEEFEIQFIDGELMDCQMVGAHGLDQANITSFIQHEATWDDWQKIRFILVVGEAGYYFDHRACNPDGFDIDVYQLNSIEELVEQFISYGLFGEVLY